MQRVFFYEITARGAEGGSLACDVLILEAFRSLGIRYWGVAPELMLHLPAKFDTDEVGCN